MCHLIRKTTTTTAIIIITTTILIYLSQPQENQQYGICKQQIQTRLHYFFTVLYQQLADHTEPTKAS